MFALFLPALVGALAGAMGSLVGRAVIALGIGFVTYKGVGAGVDLLKSRVISSVQGLPADVVGLVGFLAIDQAITIIFSAVAAALSLRLVGGSLKKMVHK